MMSEIGSGSPFLPPEVLDKIFSFLPLESLWNAAQICPEWTSIAKLSMKRRLYLNRIRPNDSKYLIQVRLRDLESHAQHLAISTQILQDEITNQASTYGKSHYVVLLDVCLSRIVTNSNSPLVAMELMPADWCSMVTKLRDKWAVQDWAAAGVKILNKFPNLEELELKLERVPGYVSTFTMSEVAATTGEFSALKNISIKLDLNQGSNFLNYSFRSCSMAYCPNLEAFNLCFVRYREETSPDKILQFEFPCAFMEDYIPRGMHNVLAMVIVPFTSMKIKLFEHQIKVLTNLGKNAVHRLKILQVDLSSNLPASNQIDSLLTFLHDRGYVALEILKLRWDGRVDGEFLMEDSDQHQSSTIQFQLSSVKELHLIQFDIASRSSIFERILSSFPNLKVLAIGAECHNFSAELLEYTAELQQLVHLIWTWSSTYYTTACDPIIFQNLEQLPQHLSRHRALKSFTLGFGGNKKFYILEQFIKACAAAPRMRVFRLFVHSPSRVSSQHADELEELRSILSFRISLSYGFGYYDIVNEVDELEYNLDSEC